nr:hypothetical protein [Tanacetum cinerariifolium]
NWHYVRDDQMFTMIKLVSRHQNTRQFGAMLHVELTNKDIRNSTTYKEYYAIASGVEPLKTKASVRKTQSSFDTTMPPLTDVSTSHCSSWHLCAQLDIQNPPTEDRQSPRSSYGTCPKEFELEITGDCRNLDDQMFTMIKLVSRHQNTQQFGAMLHVELTNKDIRNSATYKEYYAIASGAEPLKTKASVRKTQSSSDTTMPPPTAVGTRLSTSAKGKQPDKSSKEKGLYVFSEVALTEAEQMKLATKETCNKLTSLKPDLKSSDEDDDDDIDDQSDVDDDDGDQKDEDEQDDNDQDDNDDDQDSNNDSDDFVHPKLSTHDKEVKDEESFNHIVQTPSHVENYDDEGNDDASHGMNVGGDEGPAEEDDDDELYGDLNINLEVTTTIKPLPLTSPTLPPPSIPIISQVQQAPAPSPATVSSIHGIVDRYIDHRMNEAVKVAVQLRSDRLRDEAQAENEDFLNKLDENIQKIIKEQVKTFYVVAVDLSELDLKKILIEKIESNKYIHRFDEQRNLYKALVDAYECNKIILDTYGDTVMLKRRRDDEDKEEEPSTGLDWGSKRRRAGKEPESTSAPKEKPSKTSGKSTEGSKSHQKTASESPPAEEPMQTTQDLEDPSHQEFETGAADNQLVAEASQHPECDLAKQDDSHTSFNELMDTPVDFSVFLMNRLKVDTLTPKLLAGSTYELMKGSCKSLVELEFFLEEVIPFDHFINNDLEYLCAGASSRKEDDKLYEFKEGDLKRLRIQYIEDMLLLLVQGKLTNLTVEERFAFNVSLRMFTRSIVIQRHVKDL